MGISIGSASRARWTPTAPAHRPRLVVVTAGGYGYEHPDGATITPITALGP